MTEATPRASTGRDTGTCADGRLAAFPGSGIARNRILDDRRGRGQSGDGEDYALEREVKDVLTVVEAVEEPVTLLGHSLGATIALEASLRSDNIHKLILYEPAVGEHEYGNPIRARR